MTDEEIKKAIADAIGSALKPETIGAAVKAHVDAAVKPLQDRLDVAEKAAKEAAEKTAKPADEGKKEGKGKEADPETAKELAALRASLENERKAREDAENRSKAEARDAATREALAKAGIPADRLPHAMAFLGTQGVIAEKDGKVGWKGKDRFGVEALLPLEDGAKAWASTPDGKLYLPPSGAQGTGTGAGNSSGAGQGGVKKLKDISLSGVLSQING